MLFDGCAPEPIRSRISPSRRGQQALEGAFLSSDFADMGASGLGLGVYGALGVYGVWRSGVGILPLESLNSAC